MSGYITKTDTRHAFEDCTPIWLDFETYYSNTEGYTLKKLTNEQYIRDPRFELILCAYKVGVHGQIITCVGEQEIRQHLNQLPWNRAICFSHNAVFDMSILSWRLGITPAYTLCTMSLWRALMGVRYRSSLAVCAQVLGLPDKGNAVVQMDGLRLNDLNPTLQQEYITYCVGDTDLCFRLSMSLLPHFNLVELLNCHAAIQMYVQARLVLDVALLEQAKAEEQNRRENLYRICADHLGTPHNDTFIKSILSSNDKFSELLQVLGVEIPTKKSQRKIRGTDKKETVTIPAFAKTDQGFTELLESEDPIIADLCEARLLAKSTQMESRVERFLSVAQRGTLPVPIQYAGAAVTQRFGAAVDKLNLQNLQRKSLLRYAVKAPQGYKIVGGDLSQIELRFGWLVAGEYEKLKRFAQGHDPYKQIMTDTFGISYDTMSSEDRQVGKVVNLSAIFGTGVDRVREIIRLQAKRTMTEDEAAHLIRVYRQNHPQLKHAWEQGTLALECLLTGEDAQLWHNGWGRVVAPRRDDIFLREGAIYRPGGLRLCYPHLRKQKGQWDDGRPKDEYVYMRQRERGGNPTVEYIYGTKVFQNFVQAGARDVIAHAIARIVQTLPPGWHLVGQVHDELWLLVPDAETNAAAEWLGGVLVQPPEWAIDLPLACETYIADSYGEGK